MPPPQSTQLLPRSVFQDRLASGCWVALASVLTHQEKNIKLTMLPNKREVEFIAVKRCEVKLSDLIFFLISLYFYIFPTIQVSEEGLDEAVISPSCWQGCEAKNFP